MRRLKLHFVSYNHLGPLLDLLGSPIQLLNFTALRFLLLSQWRSSIHQVALQVPESKILIDAAVQISLFELKLVGYTRSHLSTEIEQYFVRAASLGTPGAAGIGWGA